MELSAELRALLEKQCFGHVVTFNRDGSLQLSPVWMEVNNGKLSFNTNTQRQKGRNLRRNPRVLVSVLDPDHPINYAIIEGNAVLETAGAEDQVHRLAGKYTGTPRYNVREGEVRVTVDIDVTRVSGRGPWVS